MSLFVSCPNCGREFHNIHPQWIGKQARCSCGAVVELDPNGAKIVAVPKNPKIEQPVSTNHPETAKRPATAKQTAPAKPQNDRAKSRPSKSNASKPRASKPSPSKRGRSLKSKKHTTQHRQERVPVVKATVESVSSSKVESKTNSKPNVQSKGAQVFGESYNDLDSILDGVGDDSPIVARPRSVVEHPRQQESTTTVVKQKPSTIGFLAALIAGTTAIWFGVFVVAARFVEVGLPLLSPVSLQIQSVNSGEFGLLNIASTTQSIFIGLGWLMWVTFLCLIPIGLMQVGNAFFRLIFHQPLFRKADYLVAALSVAASLILIMLLINQGSMQRGLAASLQDFQPEEVQGIEGMEFDRFGVEPPADGAENGPIDRFAAMEKQYLSVKQDFNFAMYFCLTATCSMLLLSLITIVSNRIGSRLE